jgi:hypothetical protein
VTALGCAAVPRVDQRDVLRADARVAIAADGERRRHLLGHEPIDRAGEQDRLRAVARIRGRRLPRRYAGKGGSDDAGDDRAPRHPAS